MVPITFSKGKRFIYWNKEFDIPLWILPTTNTMRTTTFGFGERSNPCNYKGRDSPPATKYVNNISAFRIGDNPTHVCKFGVPFSEK